MFINMAIAEYGFRQLDKTLILSVVTLLSVGLVMVASSSLDFAGSVYGNPWLFLNKQVIFLLIGVVAGIFVFSVPMATWNKFSGLFLLFSLALLVLVLVPGIGKLVNGSRRWLSFGPMTMQASEMAKFCLLIFFASYFSRKLHEMHSSWSAFFLPIIVLLGILFLLLMEPDFGGAVVISLTVGAMMFLAGVPILRFILLGLMAIVGFSSLAYLSPYRWERLVTFMDPWAEQYASGYQLVQSLIGFGRGEWFGIGLGNSLQKLFFLPEAHTDFIFSIFAEEFGFVGVILLLALYALLIYRIFLLSNKAKKRGHIFSSFLVFGIGTMLAIQVFINMGVSSGFLPTKGLTLPFISYGGSSLLVTSCLIALVLRVNWEVERGQ